MASILELKRGDAVQFKELGDLLSSIPDSLSIPELKRLEGIAGQRAVVKQVYTFGPQVDKLGFQFFSIIAVRGHELERMAFRAEWVDKKVLLVPDGKLKKPKLRIAPARV